MQKTIFTLAISFFIFSAASAQQNLKSANPTKGPAAVKAQQDVPIQQKKEGAQIDFKTTEHNFGELEEGPRVTTEFEFTNTGTKPLILTDVKASCGCTTPDWPKEAIAPGKSSVIKVEYNTQGRPGDFTKSITINSNADNGQPKIVYIKGKVIGNAQVEDHSQHSH